jgi:hypothetical protein
VSSVELDLSQRAPMLPKHFLTDESPLQTGDAVAAIIVVEDGRYLLQLRDDIPRIFYPGFWGCFGGGFIRRGARGGTQARTARGA